MRVSSLFAALLSIAVVVEASNEVIRSIPRKHARSLLNNHPNRLTKRASKRCQVKKPAANAANDKTTTSKKPASTSKSSTSGGSSSTSGGIIHVTSSECDNNGATKSITKTSGPNGNIDFLDCGINSGGWNPPNIQVDEMIVISLEAALEMPGSPYSACKPYVSLFNKYAGEYGLKPIMLAATAMEESSCNPNAQGEGGEQGLMQISKDKCTDAPDGNCKNTAFNIQKGAEYMADTLKANGGSVPKTLGEYNGWFVGMTYGDATKARNSGCCRCQNNLDYILQIMNGWYQGKDPASLGMGKYFNLNVCD